MLLFQLAWAVAPKARVSKVASDRTAMLPIANEEDDCDARDLGPQAISW